MNSDEAGQTRQRLRHEAARIEEASLWTAERHYAAETPWFLLNFWVGLPSALLAAVAGATAFSDFHNSKLLSGSISLLVAALTGMLTFLDPHKRAHLHHETAKQYELLYHQAGFFCRIESCDSATPLDELNKILTTLHTRMNEINQASPAIPARAYDVAEKHIKAGEGEVVRSLEQPLNRDGNSE